MTDFFEVELSELKILRDVSEYKREPPFNKIDESYLSFAGYNLGASPLLQDVKAFHLGFYAGVQADYYDDEESWANPLRASILEKLTSNSEAWHLSFHEYLAQINVLPFEKVFQHGFIKENNMNFTVVQSEWPGGPATVFSPRLFFEVPNILLTEMVMTFWRDFMNTTNPIEGYLLPSGRLDLLTEWDRRPRDAKLFRDVLDQSSLAFFTFPRENRHFAFITSKYTQEDLERKIDLDSLQKRAKEIGRQITKQQS